MNILNDRNFKMKLLKVLFFLIPSVLFAQETAPNFLSYRYNMNLINPAYAGAEESGALNIGFRKESYGLKDNPVTQLFSYSKNAKAYGKNIGLGIAVINDKTFITRQTDFTIDISYKLQMNAATNLYFGLKAGGAMYKIDFNSLEVNDPLFSENISTFSPLVGVGVYLKGKRYYLNASSPNLLLSDVQQPVMDDGGVFSESINEKLHLYFGGGYRFTINENLDITPSVFSRLVTDENVMIDASVLADISELIEVGATYRVDTSIIGSVLLKLMDNTHFGYAYESTTSDLGTIASGTHEFFVRFIFD